MLFYAMQLLSLYYAVTIFFRWTPNMSTPWFADWELTAFPWPMLLLLLSPFLHVIKCSFARRSLTLSFVPFPESFFEKPLISKANSIGVGVSALLVVLFGVYFYCFIPLTIEAVRFTYYLLATLMLVITGLWFWLNRRNAFSLSTPLYVGLLLSLCACMNYWNTLNAETLEELEDLLRGTYRMALPWLGYTLLYTVLIAVGCVLVRRHRAAAAQKNPLP